MEDQLAVVDSSNSRVSTDAASAVATDSAVAPAAVPAEARRLALIKVK